MHTFCSGILLLGLLLAPGVQAASVNPSEPDLHYVGRWDMTNPSQPWAQAQGSSVKVSFSSGVPFLLASGLEPGSHKIELVKETDVGRATAKTSLCRCGCGETVWATA